MDLDHLLAIKAIVLAVTLTVFAVWERLWPAAPSPLLLRWRPWHKAAWRRLGRNLGLAGLNALLSPLLVLPVTVWACGLAVGWRPAAWSGPPGLVLDLVLLDLWLYWWHRANHELPFLWRFHVVHHLDQLLDTTTALRFHVGEVALSALARAGFVVLLDFPLPSVVLFESLILACALFHHSDARLPSALERWLGHMIVTPSIHWVHHHARQADTDSNYGTLLSCWDHLFRSRSPHARDPAMPIGVERLADRPLRRLLVAPFGRQAGTNAAPRSARQ